MTGTVRGAAKRGDVQIVHTPVILRTSAKSSAATVAPTGVTDLQVVQVVATDHLTLPGATNRGLDLLGSQEIILRAPAKSPAGGTQIVSTPGGDQQLEVRWSAPTVVDGAIVVHPRYRSPLDADEHSRFPTVLRRSIVDRAEASRIRARMRYARQPWWRRFTTRRPSGW